MKYAIAVAIAIVVAIGSYVGYTRYEQQKFQESITPHVKNASLRLANAVRYETEKDTKITYKELFEKLESDIAEIDKRIIDVQTIAAPGNKEVTDAVLTYLKNSQELLRALLLKYRKQLSVSSANDRLEREMDDLRNANSYGREYAVKSAQRALKDLEAAGKEYAGATTDVYSAAKKMTETQTKVAPFIRSDALTDIAIFEAIAQKNEEKIKDAQKPETK
jgi:predicted unusual protein kinase regulating ubiquinone biosynthesis (AarF/ABC1/UbiB family)